MISKVLRRSSITVYELKNLPGEPIYIQFYAEELTTVKITRTKYLMDKIQDSISDAEFSSCYLVERIRPRLRIWIPLQTSGDSVDDVVPPHSTERSVIRPVSEQHNSESPCPTAECCGTDVGRLG